MLISSMLYTEGAHHLTKNIRSTHKCFAHRSSLLTTDFPSNLPRDRKNAEQIDSLRIFFFGTGLSSTLLPPPLLMRRNIT